MALNNIKTQKIKKKKTITPIYNCIPSANKETDWPMPPIFAKIPEAYTLQSNWWGVGDQGDTGSCVGWALADGVLRWHFVKAGKLSENTLLSVRYLWMAAKESDSTISYPITFIESAETTLKSALKIAKEKGIVLDSLLPFASGSSFKGSLSAFYAEASKLRIGEYRTVNRDPSDLRKWIATEGPILARLDVDDQWRNIATKKKQVANLSIFDSASRNGGHAVALVGYTSEGLIIRNSSGTSWGNNGFVFATDDYVKNAITETYGVKLP